MAARPVPPVRPPGQVDVLTPEQVFAGKPDDMAAYRAARGMPAASDSEGDQDQQQEIDEDELLPFGGDDYEREGVNTKNMWPAGTWYHDNTFYLAFPWDIPHHHNRKPAWWRQQVTLEPELAHVLLATQCLDELHEGRNPDDDLDDDTVAAHIKSFINFCTPLSPHPTPQEREARKNMNKIRKAHKNYDPIDLALVYVANALTARDVGGARAPSAAETELVGYNRFFNLRFEDPLRDAYCILVAFLPKVIQLHVTPLTVADLNIPWQFRLLRDVPFPNHPDAAINPDLVHSEFKLDPCIRCGDEEKPRSICFSLVGGLRSGKCYACKTQPCSKHRSDTQANRDDIMLQVGGANASAHPESEVAKAGRRVMQHQYKGR